jgi:hypothetical protein
MLLEAKHPVMQPLSRYGVFELPLGKEVKPYSSWKLIGVFGTSAEARAMKALLE